jgi:hypothetical protein
MVRDNLGTETTKSNSTDEFFVGGRSDLPKALRRQ